jgi:Dolichyl-phosphate-mannose-protein mannosyltransferase
MYYIIMNKMISRSEPTPQKILVIWIPSLVSIITITALFFLRRYDDNSLASWNIIFQCGGKPVQFFIFFSVMLLIVPLISLFRFTLPVRTHPLVLFAASAAMAALCWSIPEVNMDASRYFAQAKHLELHGVIFFLKEWGREIAAWTDLPAIPFLYGLLFRLFGESRIVIQIFTSFLFAMTAVLTWFVGKTLWDDETGLIGGFLLLGMPYLIVMAPLMLVDVPTMFFLMLSVSLFLKTLESGRKAWAVGTAGAVFFTLFCKYSALFLLSVLPFLSLIYFREHPHLRLQIRKKSVFVFLASLLLVAAAAIPVHDVIAEQIRLLLAYQKPGLGRWSESFVSTFFFQIVPLISIAAITSLFAAATRRDLKYLIIAWLPLLVFFFQIKRIRYTLPTFPMLALMAAYGITLIKDRRVIKAAVSCAVVSALALCLFAYIPYLKHLNFVNLQEAGAFLDTLQIDAAEIVPLPERNYPVNPAIAVPLLDLFTKKKIIFDYSPGESSPNMDVNLSPFRFSWAYTNPSYYRPDNSTATGKKALVMISGRMKDVVPQAIQEKTRRYTRSIHFSTACPLYEYQTFVTVFW